MRKSVLAALVLVLLMPFDVGAMQSRPSSAEATAIATRVYEALGIRASQRDLESAVIRIVRGERDAVVEELASSMAAEEARDGLVSGQILDRYYQALFGRDADDAALESYAMSLSMGDHADVLQTLLASDEFEKRLAEAVGDESASGFDTDADDTDVDDDARMDFRHDGSGQLRDGNREVELTRMHLMLERDGTFRLLFNGNEHELTGTWERVPGANRINLMLDGGLDGRVARGGGTVTTQQGNPQALELRGDLRNGGNLGVRFTVAEERP